jgi:hypothetical protein
VAEDDREVGAGGLVGGRGIACPEARAARQVDRDPDLVPETAGKLPGVPHKPGGDLQDDPERVRLADRRRKFGT